MIVLVEDPAKPLVSLDSQVGDLDVASADLDHEEHIQAAQGDRAAVPSRSD